MTKINEKKSDISERKGLLDAFVRKIENDREAMDPASQEVATGFLIDIQNEVKELGCHQEIEEACRLGLGQDPMIL
jgi:hypothetical protein